MSDPEVNPIARSLQKTTPPPRTPGKGGNVRRRVPFYRKSWFGVAIVVILIIGVSAFGMLMAFLKPLEQQAEALDITDLQKIEVASHIMDRTGEPLGKIYVQNRTPVKVDQVPMHFIQALTSAEDSRYFQHSGVDVMGILRALWLNYKAGEETQGASTITQQLARGAFELKKLEKGGDKNSRYQRKIVEWFAAERIEKQYSKSEILEMYLNRIYFGGGFYGVQAASQGYFGKDVQDLTLVESATLCGLIKSPNNLQPLRHPERSKRSRNYVFSRMYEEGYISKEELNQLSQAPVVTSPRTTDVRLSYVYEEIRQQAMAIIGEEAAQIGGFNIYTSIDRELQRTAEAAVKKRMEEVEATAGYQHQTFSYYRALLDEYRKRIKAKTIPEDTPKPQPEYLQTAVLAIDNRDGGVLAMVGGRDFVDSMFNRAVQMKRPSGTAFLPLVYATAFEKPEYFPPLRRKDGPMSNRLVMVGGFHGMLGEWGTEEEVTKFGSSISLRQSLVTSRTGATASLGLDLGLPAVKNLAERAGIKSPIQDYPSSFLGASDVRLDEMCLAYSTFANQGKRPKKISIITRITDLEGKTIYQVKKDEEVLVEAMDEVAAYQTHSCLVEALKKGTGRIAYDEYGLKDFPAAGKTGTHYEFKDLWFVGYTSSVTCAVWSGFDQQKQIYEGAFSKRVVLPLWTDVMNATTKNFPPQVIQPPQNVQLVEVCSLSGLRALDTCYEKVPDPVTGRTRAVRKTFTEVLRQRSNFDQFCDLHSNGEFRDDVVSSLGSASDSLRDSLVTISPEVANVAPVRMKGLTVLGADPYNTVQPVLRAEPVLEDGSTVQRAVPVEEPAEAQTPIKLAPPPPMKLD